MKLLRTMPELNAKNIVAVTLYLVKQVPEPLYDKLVRHPFDARLYEQGDVFADT